MEKLNFHMILQKSFYYVDLVLKKHAFFTVIFLLNMWYILFSIFWWIESYEKQNLKM